MDITIHISAKRWAVVLGLIVALLVAASIGASYLSLVPIVHPVLSKVRESVIRLTWLDGECNIPSWFSSALLLVCALLLGVIAAAQRQQRDSHGGRWLVLALIFGFLSLDETAQLHELSIAPLRDTFHTGGYLQYPWIIPAGICVAVFVLSYLSFLAKLPRNTRWLFVLAGAIYVGGALGVEALSGKQASLHGEHNLAYHAITTVEELLEMAGVVVFIYALLDYIGRQFTTLRFHVASR
jgi:hypothetical protein